jgi:tRNA pseudouridine32 synthase/23S rRNA pseudouridine746 synthase
MGEFWYGESPSAAVRTEGHFYPSCTSKCGPLLGYMLQGMEIIKMVEVFGDPSVLYEDEDIIAVSKPSGMPSVPGLNCGLSMLEWLAAETGCSTLESVHRLDMDTSGIMIFAKNPSAGSHIRKQFEEHSVRKTYKALVSKTGTRLVSAGESGTICIPLSPDYDERPRQKADLKQGKEAITEYHIDEVREDGILVTFNPLTGRTHQLRVHSAHHLGLGHPISGDMLYGGANDRRLRLHAEEITITHPSTGEEASFRDDTGLI